MNHLETTAAALHGLALLSRQLKNLTDARAFLEESLTLRRRLRARRGIAECLVELGTLDVEAGNLPRARRSFLAALDVATEAGATAVVLDAVLGLIELRDPLERGAPLRKVLETIARHPAAEPSTRTRAALFLGAPAHWKPLTATPPLATLIAAVLLHA